MSIIASVPTRLLSIVLAMSLAACNASDSTSSTDSGGGSGDNANALDNCLSECTTVEKLPAYSLAQGCYAIRSETGHYLNTTSDSYRFSPSSEEDAEAFFLKPSRLGAFLLYDRNGHYLAEDFLNVTRLEEANERAEWNINLLDLQRGNTVVQSAYSLVSPKLGLRLQVISDKPVLRDTPLESLITKRTAFEFIEQPQDRCATFPEAALDAVVSEEFYREKDPTEPVVGYVDVHTHIGFPKTMGGVAMSGDIFSPYGIEHALHDCAHLHGKQGALDFLEAQHVSGGANGHDTAGYPDFSYWPNRSTNTHVQAYYRWIQRAYLGGLRVMVTLVTGNPSFCQLLGIMHLGNTEGGCSGVDAMQAQTDYLYELEDYIDAQEGGPGKGWFRIVTSPSEARAAIAKNQLAVVLGAEHGTLFDCTDGNNNCDEAYVDEKLDQVHAMGVRSIFPLHRFDNAFGGTKPSGGSGGSWMHLTGMMTTTKMDHILDLIDPTKLLFKTIGGHYWDMDACPEGANGTTGIQSMEEFITDDFSLITDAAASLPTVGPLVSAGFNAIFLDKIRPLPDYEHLDPHGPSCNQRTLQPIGEYLIHGLIDRKMIVEIDHMSYQTLLDTIDILEDREYSGFISSHGWFDNTSDIRSRLLSLGGLLTPMNSNPSTHARRIQSHKDEIEAYGYTAGLGFGSDIQGVTSQTNSDSGVTISYPFMSVDGTVTFTQPQTGNRQFSYADEGVAHYGLFPEWLENLRQVDAQRDDKIMDTFMNSAEAYLQMWERAEANQTE